VRTTEELEKTWVYAYAEKVGDIAVLASLRTKELGITKAELARRMGISRSTVSEMLGGDNNFTIKTLAKLAKALDMSIEEIVAYKRPTLDEIQSERQPERLALITDIASDQPYAAQQWFS